MRASSPSPGRLAAVLGALPVRVEEVAVETGVVALPSYGPEGRPTGEVRLSGGGATGRGECVAWTDEGQRRFAAEAEATLRSREGEVGEMVDRDADPYWRAALEGALIDLALRQDGRTMAEVTGVREREVAHVLSFDRGPDPAGRLEAIREANPGARFKVDVDPEWGTTELEQLAATGAVAVLDFKEGGDAELVRRAAASLPDALLEDPPVDLPGAAARTARDRGLLAAQGVNEMRHACGWLNLKAPRMGGFLEVLHTLEGARSVGLGAYFGGMFELGVGRRQAQALAALFTPRAPNDLAPVVPRETDPRPRPLRVRLDRPGFGSLAP